MIKKLLLVLHAWVRDAVVQGNCKAVLPLLHLHAFPTYSTTRSRSH